jgi:hypothetical protein
MSKVILKSIPTEYIFDFFCSSIHFSGGDGAAVICCGNHIETANYFDIYYKRKYHIPLITEYRKKICHDNHTIIFTDGNENYMFSNQDISFPDKWDVTFVVDEDSIATTCNKSFIVKRMS